MADLLGVGADEFCAFGDESNDWEMFEWVGHSISPLNGPTLPSFRCLIEGKRVLPAERRARFQFCSVFRWSFAELSLILGRCAFGDLRGCCSLALISLTF
jgi:hypothetical protein